MAKNGRDDQVAIRISRTLRAELEDAATTEGRGLSNLIREVLIKFCAARRTDRAAT